MLRVSSWVKAFMVLASLAFGYSFAISRFFGADIAVQETKNNSEHSKP